MRVAARAAVLACALAAGAGAGAAPPSFAEVRHAYVPSEAVLVDRHGVALGEIRADARVRRLAWVALDDVSPALTAALVAGEDRRFHEHAGVDWAGLAVAAWDSAWRALDGRRPRGGSTLTMQLAGLLDPALAPGGRQPRTLAQKWDQAAAALSLERTWTKREILEAYVNLASYRGELTGLRAAAQGLFGKAPSGLDARESAVLVALLRAPGAPRAVVAQRACAVAAAVEPAAACEPVRALASVALSGGYRIPAGGGSAPHVAARATKAPGARIATTLDAELQAIAQAPLRDHLAALAGRNVGDGAVVVLDNATGDVLAYVGGDGERASAPEVDGAAAPRQAGSTLKPFLYALAVDAKLLTAASLVDDSPLALSTARGVYVPQNYDRAFRGSVSVRTALAGSLNVPAVRTAELIGLPRFHETLRALGFATLTEPADWYGASLALGGADVTLLALTNAYRTLANGGAWSEPRMFAGDGTPAARRVFGAPASFVVADILADRGARAGTFGLENPLATRVWSAAKTGTSKDMRDNWCIGFTARYTVGVWVGNFTGAPPIWRDVVHWLHRAEAALPPQVPAGVVRADVAFDPAVEAPRAEWFVAGTALPTVRAAARADADGAPTPRIRTPAPDTVVALDPDIPPRLQRVPFVAAPERPDLRWRLDDVELAERGGRALWRPAPGRHTLVLADDAGRELARVTFDVRGGWAASERTAAVGGR